MIHESDIDRSHRVGPTKNGIIVKFTSYRAHQKLLVVRKDLRKSDKNKNVLSSKI